MIGDHELTPEEAEQRVREIARRMLTTPKPVAKHDAAERITKSKGDRAASPAAPTRKKPSAPQSC